MKSANPYIDPSTTLTEHNEQLIVEFSEDVQNFTINIRGINMQKY